MASLGWFLIFHYSFFLFKKTLFISKICSTHWILDMISGTAIYDAISFGESKGDCHQKYNKCGLGTMHLEDLFEMFKESIN